MDGFTRLFTIPSLLIFVGLVGCAGAEQGGTFQKTSAPECVAAAVKGQYLVNWKDGSQTLEYEVDDDAFVKNFVQPNEKDILVAEPDYVIKSQNEVGSFATTLDDSDIQPNWGAYDIKADVAWNSGFKGQSVLVAVVDSGVDITHPQLVNQVAINQVEATGKAGIDDDKNGYVDDVYGYNFSKNSPNQLDEMGHGTHVSGIILAEHGKGNTLGVAPGAKLIPVDFMDKNGGLTSAAIAALDYAVSRGAQVINASWGSSMCSVSLRMKFQELEKKNILLMVAAGNSGNDLSWLPEYPAVFHGINQITVGALDPSGLRAVYSNYGTIVDLLAPGSYIESTVPASIDPSQYAYSSGTSMATPFLTGMAAVLWSKKPSATAAEIKAAILNSVDLFQADVKPRGKARLDKALSLL